MPPAATHSAAVTCLVEDVHHGLLGPEVTYKEHHHTSPLQTNLAAADTPLPSGPALLDLIDQACRHSTALPQELLGKPDFAFLQSKQH